MYTRSPRFAACAALLLEHGASCEEPALAALLRDDSEALRGVLQRSPATLACRIQLECAFTPLRGASLLHVACEFQHLDCVRVLLDAGAAVEARADTDAHGFDGHTALFHCVNAHADGGAGVRALLLAAGARVDVRLPGLVWGRGFEWETTCFDVTPVSYAQLGLLPQMHRDEVQIRATIGELLHASGRTCPAPRNVPNRYLHRRD
jgi:ankyrin repeat protein